MLKFIALVLLACVFGVLAKPLAELRIGNTRIDTDHIDCKTSEEIIDECGLQQGYSYRFSEFAYPTNHSHLMTSCKRQFDALKCLKAYAKCLPPLSKQVLITMVNSRQKFSKKVCTEKANDYTNKVLELGQCMSKHRNLIEKGMQAELNSIVTPEAIVSTKIDSIQERLKHSCCSVAKARREFIDTTIPNCKQHIQTATDLIDSYLAETVGIICPDFEGRQRNDCDKLPKLSVAKSSNTRNFLGPILNVVQTLA